MAVLAMDTSTQALVAAVGNGEQTLAASVSLIPRGHSRLLQPMIQQLMHAADLSQSDLESVAVGVGPGSYTGVRLAVSTAKAMAVALGIPVTPIPTLASLAEAAVPFVHKQPVYVMPLLYARRQRAFGAIYVKTGVQWTCVEDTRVKSVTDWMATLGQETAGRANVDCMIVHDFGDGSDAHVIRELENARTWADMVLEMTSVAADIGPAMLRIAKRQDFLCTPRNGEDVHALVPDYALRVEAEVKQSEGSTADGAGRGV